MTTGSRDIRSPENRKYTEWPETELEHLTIKRTLYTLIVYPEAHILVRFPLRLAVSEIQYEQGRQKSEMHRMTLNWAWQLNSQKYSIHIYLLGPNCRPFFSTISGFRDIWSPKIGNVPNDPKLNLNTLTVKTSLYILNTYPWRPYFGPVRSAINRFRGTTYVQSRRNRKCHDWPQT